MATLKNVVVAGASGKALGPAIVQALVSAGFNVSILSRSVSESPADVPTLTTDYTPSSLESALRGQDAVVSCVGFPGLLSQVQLVDAAEAAGVQRFVPSEFGHDTPKGGLEELWKVLGAKKQVLDHVRAVTRESTTLSYTGLATGPFLDWNLAQGAMGFDWRTRSATIYDSGDEPWTGTVVAEIARCVVRILQKPTETPNTFLRVRSLQLTQNTLLSAFEAHTQTQWTVTHVSTQDALASGREKLKKGDRSFLGDILAVQFFQDGCGRGVVSQSAEEGEEGMRILQPAPTSLDALVETVLGGTQ